MKRFLCWILMGTLLLAGCAGPSQGSKEETTPTAEATCYSEPTAAIPSAQIPVVTGYDDFMAVLSAAILHGTENKNLSPVSVYLALAMAAEGAQGETQAELLALMGEQSIEDLRKSAEAMLHSLPAAGETGELALANSFWLGKQDETVTFREAYLKTLSGSYGAEAYAVRFGDPATGERIAAWIREKTRDKIQPSKDATSFDADTIAVLINTIYLKDGWRMPFNEDLTEKGIFHEPEDRTRQVMYMHRKDTNATVVRGDGYLRYALPLNELGSMVFVLPDEGVSLESLLGSAERIDALLSGGEQISADVDLMVPKFGFQDRTDLIDILRSLGVHTCFTGAADFSAMTDTPAHISRALQESYVGVDENGVTAAAYTMIAFAKSAAIPVEREKVDFHLTRPFLYAVESQDGTVLFIGTVTAPDEA